MIEMPKPTMPTPPAAKTDPTVTIWQEVGGTRFLGVVHLTGTMRTTTIQPTRDAAEAACAAFVREHCA